MDLRDYLKKCHFGRDLDDDELMALADIAGPRQLAKGEILFFEGDPAAGFFILLSGRVRIYKSSPDGKEYTIHQISPGQIFAEVAVFHGGKFPANCAAMQDSFVAHFPKDKFLNLIKNSPQISLKIISSLAAFLRDYNQQIENLTMREVPGRLASFLLREAAKRKSNEVILDYPKTELARRLGTISETLSRALRRLKEMDLIAEDGKIIVIKDPARLEDVASGEKI